jgi:hypothetical protein
VLGGYTGSAHVLGEPEGDLWFNARLKKLAARKHVALGSSRFSVSSD